MKTKTTTAQRIESLAECFRRAREAGEAAGVNPEDDGTCNLDSPAFRLPRVRDAIIQEAAELAGVRVDDFKWLGGRRWYWLRGFIQGQANLRARISTAATRELKEAATELCPEMEVIEYQQCD